MAEERRSCFIAVAQVVAGIAAAAMTKGLLPGDRVLFNVGLSEGISIVQGLFLEMFLTAQLLIAIFLLATEVGPRPNIPQGPLHY
jgi:aquaporin rerated protein, other eukaryote